MGSLSKSRYGNAALAAAVALLAIGAAGCGGTGNSAQATSTGSARVAIASPQLSATVASVQLTISAGTGPAFTPIVDNLSQSASGWTAYVTGIPVGPGRNFNVVAMDASGNTLFTGSGTADIIAGALATVVININSSSTGTPFNTSSPVIDYVSASATLVAPGGTVRLGASATDPDPTATLSYQWQAACGTFDTPTSSAATWTAPGSAQNCQISLTVTNNSGSAVTAYLVINVGVTTGDVLVTVTGSTTAAPVITAMTGKVTYGTTEQGDLSVVAADPGGYTLSYAWSSNCKNLTFNTSGSYTVTTPHYSNPDLTLACVITVTVTDAQGGSVTGVISVPPAPAFQTGPVITSTVQPSVDPNDPNRAEVVSPGDAVMLGAQATDPQGNNLKFAWSATAGTLSGQMDSAKAPWKSVVVYNVPSPLAATMQVTLTVTDTANNEYATHVFTFKGSASTNPCAGQADGTACNDGNKCNTNETCQGGVCKGTAVVCTASDQCHAAGTCDPTSGTCSNPPVTDGSACNDGNACTTSDVCAAGVCMGAAVTCKASDQCHVAGTCDPTSGACSNPTAANGTACNDGNACTQTDTCQAGVCAGSNPVVCTGGATCNPATGTCSGGASPAALSAVLTPSTTTVNTGQAFTATLAVRNTGGTAANAVQPAAMSVCTGPTPSPVAIPAGSTANFGFTNCSSSTPGTLTLSTSASGTDATTSATVTTGTVTGTVTVKSASTATGVAPQVAKDLPITGPVGLAMDISGNTYMVGDIYTPNGPVSFDGHSVVSAGDADIFVAKYDVTGKATWAVAYGDPSAQYGVGAAVTNDGTVAVLGNFLGTVTIGTGTISSATQIDYLAAVKAADGTGLWAQQFNDGSNGLLKSVSANASDSTTHGNRIAVCGLANGGAPTNLVGSGATAPGGNDIIIGAFSSTGTKLWAAQYGGTLNEECDAVAVDDNGDVYAAGSFSGATLTFGTLAALTGPNNNVRSYLWVAKFNGATGAPIAAAAFTGTAVMEPFSIAVDASDNVVVGGAFTGNVTLGSTVLTSAGNLDALVAKLNSSFAPTWAVRLGASGPDSTNGVAFDSLGDVIVAGAFNTPAGTPTTGAAALTSGTKSASNPFVLKLNGTTGAADSSAAYSDIAAATGDAIAVNRYGTTTNQIGIAGTFGNSITFPAPAGPVTATTPTDVWFLTAILQ